jgi:hypothetical protein
VLTGVHISFNAHDQNCIPQLFQWSAWASRICPAYVTALSTGNGPLSGNAIDQFHHQIIPPDIVQRADVRMIKSSDGPCLPIESRRELRLRNLYRNVSVQLAKAGWARCGRRATRNLGERS